MTDTTDNTMSTYRRMAENIGRRGVIEPIRGFRVNVQVIDARSRYGGVDWLIVPCDGTGQAWVRTDRVQLASTEETSHE